MNNLSIVSAKCGLGKTYHLVKSVYESSDLYHVIAAPSVKIADQIKKEFNKVANELNIPTIVPTIINSESYDGKSVNESIRTYLTDLTNTKQVLIITHKSYHSLPKSYLKPCVVHVDEIPDIWIERVTVGYDWNHSHDKYFNTTTDGLVTLNNNSKGSNETLENSKLYSLIQMLKDESVFVHSLGESDYEEKNLQMHQYLVVISPEYFTSRTILYTADDHVSDIVAILRKQMSIPVVALPASSRKHHYNTEFIEFVYFMDDRKNSLNVARTRPNEYDDGLNEIISYMGSFKSLVLMNKEIEKRITLPDNFIPINHNIHGMHDYKYMTRIVVQSAINRSPSEEKCLMDFYNLTEEQIFNSRIANIHQAIMRLAIRREDFNEVQREVIRVGVVDLQTAHACKSLYFPNATLTKVGNTVFKTRAGRPVGYRKENALSSADNTKGKQIRQKLKTPEKFGYTKNDVMILSMCKNTHEMMKLDLWNKISKSGIMRH